MSVTNIDSVVSAIKTKLAKETATGLSNYERRVLHSVTELKILDLEIELNKESDASQKLIFQTQIDDLTATSKSLRLKFNKRKFNIIFKIIDKLDELIRTIASYSFLMLASFFLVLPSILFRPVDSLLVKWGVIGPKYQVSILTKCFIAMSIIRLAGIDLQIEGMDSDLFGTVCSLVCFSHASTMDAFILSATVPVRHYTLGKAELFLVPFFSWCLMAFGGVPIDRKNRDQAVRAITKAAASAKEGDCIAMSPEGTRSKSGQLLPFKKGPFHLWEQLQTPIVPMVTLGAYELYPPGKTISNCGKVYVKFLKSVQPAEAASRDEMSLLLRRRMLESVRDGPLDAGQELTWAQRVQNWVYLTTFYGSLYALWQFAPAQKVSAYFNITQTMLCLWIVGGSVVITLVFYVYMMYLVHLVDKIKVSLGLSAAEVPKVSDKRNLSMSWSGDSQDSVNLTKEKGGKKSN